MSQLSFSDLVNEAWKTGKDAVIEYGGESYLFNPEGLLTFIEDNISVNSSSDLTPSSVTFSNFLEINSGGTSTLNIHAEDTGNTLVITLAGLPTSDPVVAGQLWNDTGVLKISAGV